MTKFKKNYLNSIFAIPLDGERYSYGHIIANGYGSDCYIIYDIVAKEHPSIEKIMDSSIIIFMYTLHQKIVSGEWKVIGNAPLKQTIKMPEYKIDVRENGITRCMVMRFDGEILRPATETEIKNLKTKHSCTPGVLEKVVKAKYGVIPWQNKFNDYLYKFAGT